MISKVNKPISPQSLVLIFLFALIGVVAPVQATLITISFNDGAGELGDFDGLNYYSYLENGIKVIGEETIGHPAPPITLDNETLWTHGSCGITPYFGCPFTFTSINGSTFDLISVEVSGGRHDFYSSSGAHLTQSWDPAVIDFSAFDEWTNLSSFTWASISWGAYIDNVVLRTHDIPEPTTVSVMTICLLVFARQRKYANKSQT